MMCNEKIDYPLTLDIKEIINEGKDLITLRFDHELNAKSGQFVMLWNPRIGLKPFSVAYQKKDNFGLTIFGVGEFTNKLLKVKKGDKLGIQGPYGTSYSKKGKNVALIGGGCGTASIALLADEMIKQDKKVHFIVGARDKESLLYINRFKDSKINMIFCTDDGSYGFNGFTTQALNNLLEKEKIDMIYTCGPEIMMKKIIEISDEKNIDCEASMERYMKCGFGICGQCAVDYKGLRICKEGPVMNKEIIKKIPDFGNYKRDASGNKISY